LEADALHFSSDIWTSLAVLFGLSYAQAAHLWAWPAAALMDSLAAVAVALLVLWVSFRMGRRACGALLDVSPERLGPVLTEAIRSIKGVSEPVRVRTRRAGGHLFVDVRASLDRRLPLEEACRISRQLEDEVRKTAGEPVDFLLHTNSFVSSDEPLTAKVRHAARMEGVTAHNIKLLHGADLVAVDLHLEVEGNTPLEEAHVLAHRIEKRVREEDAGVGDIVIHLEPLRDPHAGVHPAKPEELVECLQICREAVAAIPGIRDCENVNIISAGNEEQRHLHLTAHVLITLPATVGEAHRRCEKMEDFLRERLPHVRRITLHAEPEKFAALKVPQT
jgi:divalent metal cation (Fe/Co/Zn/Cd) transporter